MENKSTNLMEGLQSEMNRCRQLVILYADLGPVGTFGKIAIQQCIDDAEKAINENDVVKMLQAYEALKGCE